MAINWKSPTDWRSRNRGIKTDYNGIVFSLAWKEDGIWKTFYRKFHLKIMGRVLIGEFPSNLHFNEKLKRGRVIPSEDSPPINEGVELYMSICNAFFLFIKPLNLADQFVFIFRFGK